MAFTWCFFLLNADGISYVKFGMVHFESMCNSPNNINIVYIKSTQNPGGTLRYRMATHCQTVVRSGSGERQNIGAVNSFQGKKGGRALSN